MSYQALTLMLLYIIGFVMAIFSAYVLDKVLKIQRKTFFVVEMPSYKVPLIKNVIITVIEKTKTFVFEAGKNYSSHLSNSLGDGILWPWRKI